MTDHEEDLELLALQRQLDDAFETTRPRRGFEDELWSRMQSARPAQSRLRDALAGLFRAIRETPAVPAAAVATVLVIAIGVGLFAYSGLGRGGAGTANMSASGGGSQVSNGDQASGGFGLLPSPVFDEGSKSVGLSSGLVPGAAEYPGAAQLTFGPLNPIGVSVAPVFRYREPSTNAADQFASALGAVLRGRPQGFLGSYTASDYTLKVRGTVQSPPSSPAYFIVAGSSMPPVEAAGASQSDVASLFLAAHSLMPQWDYTIAIDQRGDPVRVFYQRQIQVAGYGGAYVVDWTGARTGIEVDLSSNRPVVVSGPLPVSMEAAMYNLVSPATAIVPALGAPNVATVTPPPTIQLTKVELVYVLVPAGDRSYFEPAYLFSGTVKLNSVTYAKHVLEPAVDPSQRSR